MKQFASFNNLTFADNERPTSYKFNQIKALFEYTRLANGPYIIQLHSGGTTQFITELLEDPTEIGGLKDLGGGTYETRAEFIVYYETRASNTLTYASWETTFVDTGDGRLLATLTSGNNLYDNAANISGVQNNMLHCKRGSGYTTE